MMRPAEDVEVYLCRDPVDMRNYAVPGIMLSAFRTGAVLSSRGRSAGPMTTGDSA